MLELWAASREQPSEAIDHAMHALEIERWDMLAITDPAQLQQFSGEVFPPAEWGTP